MAPDDLHATEPLPTAEVVVDRFVDAVREDVRLVRRPVTRAAHLAARLLGPFLIVSTFLAGVYVLAPHLWERMLGLMAFYLTPLGEEAGVPVGLHLGIPPALIVTLIVLVDLQFALFMLLNGDHLKRVPRIGAWLQRGEAKTRRFYAKHPLMSKAGFLGVAAFVMLPLAGTGSISGAVLGKMMGFGPTKALLAIAVGSLARSVSFVLACLGLVSVIT